MYWCPGIYEITYILPMKLDVTQYNGTFWNVRMSLEQNSLNPISHSLKILLLHQLRKINPSLELFQKSLQDCLYTHHCGISWPFVSYSINFFSYVDSLSSVFWSFSFLGRNWRNSRKNRTGTLRLFNWQLKEKSNWKNNWLVMQPNFRSSNI